MDQQLVVVYKKGGTSNFSWHVVFEVYYSEEPAMVMVDKLITSGYPAKILSRKEYVDKGVPNTWEGGWK